MTDFGRRLLPHDASLTDDRSTSDFPVMGVPTGADIVGALVARSGSPETGMLVPRNVGTDGICETCQLPPDRAVQEGHPYVPMVNRVPGVHGSIDDPGRAPHNFDPAVDAPGQDQVVNDDPALDSAEARFRQASSRWVPYQPGEGPFPVR
jgi:hypothetical protein